MQQETPQIGGTSYALQEIATYLDKADISNTEEVVALVDVSPFRLWLLFKSVDTDKDGYVSKEELLHCLTNTEERHPRVALSQPVQQLRDMLLADESDEQEDGRIPFTQFCRLIRYLWLQQLLTEDLDDPSQKDYTFEYIDYSGSFYKQERVPGLCNEQSRRFFQVPRHSRAKMRWIHVPYGSASVISILRLSVKYRFHPTSVEDAIELEDQSPKVNAFEYSLLDLGDFSMDSLFRSQHGKPDENDKDSDETMGQDAGGAAESAASTTKNERKGQHCEG